MTLGADDIVDKRFTQTKFRLGYDRDEVDDFLDEVVAELRRLTGQPARAGGARRVTCVPRPSRS